MRSFSQGLDGTCELEERRTRGLGKGPHLASVKAEHRKVRPPLWAYLGDGVEGAQI